MDGSPLQNERDVLNPENGRAPRGEYPASAGSEDSYRLVADRNRKSEERWAARLVCAGSLLTLVYEVVFLFLDRRFLSTTHPKILIFHGINISLFVLAVIMAARVGPWTRRHWKLVAFSFSSLMIASSACIALQTSEEEPLTIALILFLAGTGPFLCWGEKTQAGLTAAAVIAFAIVSQSLSAGTDWYQWLGLLVGAAIGLFSTALERRLRRAQHRAEDELLKAVKRWLHRNGRDLLGSLPPALRMT
jgi:hypothetical protein